MNPPAAGKIVEFAHATLSEQSDVLPATILLRGVVLRRIVNAPSPCYIGSLGVRALDAKYFVMLDQELGGWAAFLQADGNEIALARGDTAVQAAQRLDSSLDVHAGGLTAEWIRRWTAATS